MQRVEYFMELSWHREGHRQGNGRGKAMDNLKNNDNEFVLRAVSDGKAVGI